MPSTLFSQYTGVNCSFVCCCEGVQYHLCHQFCCDESVIEPSCSGFFGEQEDFDSIFLTQKTPPQVNDESDEEPAKDVATLENNLDLVCEEETAGEIVTEDTCHDQVQKQWFGPAVSDEFLQEYQNKM